MGTSEVTLSKRQFLGMLAAASTASLSPVLFAGDNTHAQHAAASSNSKELVAAAEECVSIGQECKAHIYQTLKSDDLSLTQCLIEVRNTIAVCNSLVEVLTNGSVHDKALAKVCADICAVCRDECNKHAAKHPICKTMADSCDKSIKACLKYIG